MYGANLALCQLILELKENYPIIPIVLLPSRGDLCDYLDEINVKYYISHYYWWVNENKGIFQLLLNYRKQLRNLLKVPSIICSLSKEKIDLVYTNSVTVNIGTFIGKKLKCPHIWHLRETLIAYNFKYSLPNFWVRRIFFKGADQYIVISDFLHKYYNNYLPEDKVKKVYDGICLDNNRLRINHYDEILNICIVGLVSEQKNQMDAVKAIKILNDKGHKNIKLYIIGGAKNDYLKKITAYVVENSLENNIIFSGHKTNINELLDQMNIGLMCSHDEAFGRVSIEYMLHCLPTIASKSGANEELFEDGLNGKLYELYNDVELAEKIEMFIDNSFLLETMGSAAFEYARQNFLSGQNSKAIYSIMENLLSKSENKG